MVLVDNDNPSRCVCRPGTFLDYDMHKCIKCHPRCETCSGPTEDDCMTCKATAYVEVKDCRGLSCECAPNYILNEYT